MTSGCLGPAEHLPERGSPASECDFRRFCDLGLATPCRRLDRVESKPVQAS